MVHGLDMHKFKDDKGSTWFITLNVGQLLEIKTCLDVDFLDKPGDMPDSLETFVDAIWMCCRDQARQIGIDEEAFAHRLGGGSFKDAIDCFIDELSSFFLSIDPMKSKAIKGLWEKLGSMNQKQADALEKALGTLSFD